MALKSRKPKPPADTRKHFQEAVSISRRSLDCFCSGPSLGFGPSLPRYEFIGLGSWLFFSTLKSTDSLKLARVS